LPKSLSFPTSIPKEIHSTTRFASSLESTEVTEGEIYNFMRRIPSFRYFTLKLISSPILYPT